MVTGPAAVFYHSERFTRQAPESFSDKVSRGSHRGAQKQPAPLEACEGSREKLVTPSPLSTARKGGKGLAAIQAEATAGWTPNARSHHNVGPWLNAPSADI